MDIKLKNKHRISVLLSVVLVAAAAVVMVGLYPYFEMESKSHERPAYSDQAFLRYLVFGNYVLDLEQEQEETGVSVFSFQHFMPQAAEELENREKGQAAERAAIEDGEEADTEAIDAVPEDYIDDRTMYLQDLRKDMSREFETWRRYFKSIRLYLDYQVQDDSGEILLDNAGGQDMVTDNRYVFKTVISYDNLGHMEVKSVTGENSDYIGNVLRSFGENDPMDSHYYGEYEYDSSLRLKNPVNRTFIYGMTREQLAAYSEDRNDYLGSYYNPNRVMEVFIGVFAAVAVLSLLFSCFDVTRADDSKVFRAPFELVAVVTWACIGFGYWLTNLVAMTNRGRLYDGLVRANFLPRAAETLITLWNIMWWCVPFAAAYWAVVCLRDVFHIGLKRYLRERTFLGWFVGWCVRMCRSAYGFLSSIDLQDKTDKTIFKIVGINFLILAVLCSMWFFGIGALVVYSVVLFIILRKYYRDLSAKYKILLDATNQIAEGNLDVNIEEELGVFEPFKTEVQKIQSGFKVAVDEEVKSQRMKTDLITNMSHDLKTPLTAIITYVSLLRDDKISPEQRRAYIDVLEQKSMRLKSLIEDLFEISKANSNDVTLNLVDVDIVSLLKEVSFELSDKIEESTIDFRWNLPDEKIVLPLDSQKTYRIFDNLLTNIIKYAMSHTRAYIDMKREDGCVVISMKNVSASELTFNPQEITERFVRGDQSRNTEGSGLGMAIAKSFVEVQNGHMSVETEADLFRVTIRWPVEEENEDEKNL